jgi:hypothetical protein
MRIICKLEKRALVRIIFKLEKRALDADYLQVRGEGPGADYLQVGEEGPGRGLFAKCRKGHVCGVARGKGGLGLGFFTVGRRAPIVDF